MLIDGDTGRTGEGPVFNITGICPNCGKELGRLKSVSQWIGTKGYPQKDPIIYHVSPWLTKAKVYCESD